MRRDERLFLLFQGILLQHFRDLWVQVARVLLRQLEERLFLLFGPALLRRHNILGQGHFRNKEALLQYLERQCQDVRYGRFSCSFVLEIELWLCEVSERFSRTKMKRLTLYSMGKNRIALLLCVTTLWMDLWAQCAIDRERHMQDVLRINTMVGTAKAETSSAGMFGRGSEEQGQTLPAVLVPNGQNFWTPQTQATEEKCVAPFYYADTLFQGFRCSHWLVGGCAQDYGSFTIGFGIKGMNLWDIIKGVSYEHENEESHPHRYALKLPNQGLKAEMTALSHAATIQLKTDRDTVVCIVLRPNSDRGEGFVEIDTNRRMLFAENQVYRIYQGWGERAGFSGHMVLSYGDLGNGEIVDFGILDEKNGVQSLITKGKGKGVAAYVMIRTGISRTLLLRGAGSFTDRDGCVANLIIETEDMTKSFEKMSEECADSWIERFHAVCVEDEDTALTTQFYGALYRSSFLPREMSDADGRYPVFASDGVIGRTKRHRVYGDFSMWDIYRAQLPLLYLIAPDMAGEMMESLVLMYREGGWLPIFPCWNSYTAAMIGDHSIIALADACIKGIGGFDIEEAYEAICKNAFEKPLLYEDYASGKGRRSLDSYLKYGYVPMEDSVLEAFHRCEQTSRTLEYVVDDYAAAQVAHMLGHNDDYEQLIKRTGWWRNVINPLTGYADGRYADGTWMGNRLQFTRQSFITEGAPCHYTFYVPHDIEGLAEYVGGKDVLVAKLDSLFECGGYWHGNEPCHQIAYMYNYCGAPEKTRERVSYILKTEYEDNPGGLSGNDDAGQMSAWYVFGVLGFYPVCPATGCYDLSEPLFRKVTLNLKNGKQFVILRKSKEESTEDQLWKLNGKTLTKNRIKHNDIIEGGMLVF